MTAFGHENSDMTVMRTECDKYRQTTDEKGSLSTTTQFKILKHLHAV